MVTRGAPQRQHMMLRATVAAARCLRVLLARYDARRLLLMNILIAMLLRCGALMSCRYAMALAAIGAVVAARRDARRRRVI